MLRVFGQRTFGAPAYAADPVPDGGAVLPGDCAPACAVVCPDAFDQVRVTFANRTGATIYWRLLPTFTDPAPHRFQLQQAETDAIDADWTNVGAPVVNAFYAEDAGFLPFARSEPPFYRVKLTTAKGNVYYSAPTSRWGVLSKRGWRQVQTVVQGEIFNHKRNPGSSLGWLLKLRTTGENCPRCFDRETRTARDPLCPVCYGTGLRCGYYAPIGCVWANLSTSKPARDLDPQRGPVYDSVRSARMTLSPLFEDLDIWVHGKNGDRYYVHQRQTLVEVEDVPIVAQVEMKLAKSTDIIYAIPVPPV